MTSHTPELRDAVVLGAAVGYTPQQIEPFVRSLRNAGYTGDVAMVVDRPLGRALGRHPGLADVIAIPVPRYLPRQYRFNSRKGRYWRAWGGVERLGRAALATIDRLPVTEFRRRVLIRQVAQHLYQPTETRYFHFHRFLAERPYERVLISDVRDVLFQSDPFEQLPREGLATGIETPEYTLATQPFNRELVLRAYGTAGLEEIGDRLVSCCGVTYGDLASMRRYLTMMMDEILTYNSKAARKPTDQAPHNYILWTGRFGDFQELHSLSSPVATLAAHAEADIPLSADGRVLNRDGSVPSIVHQLDRWPELERTLVDTLTGGGRM